MNCEAEKADSKDVIQGLITKFNKNEISREEFWDGVAAEVGSYYSVTIPGNSLPCAGK